MISLLDKLIFPSRRGILALFISATAIAIIACTSDDVAPTIAPQPTATTVPTATETPAPEPASAPQPTATVAPIATEVPAPDTPSAGGAPVALSVNTHPVLGDIVTDSDGLTLYIFSNDTPGVSNCSGGCLSAWPPVLAALGATGGDITGDLGVITREDGDVQVTLNDLPLYYYRDDTTAGDANGQALGNVWWVVGADGASIDTPLVT